MARPAAIPPEAEAEAEAEARPALLSAHTPRAIRDALVGSERAEFEHDYHQAMTEAAGTLDLTEVLKVLDVYRELAEIAQRQGPDAHLRMLEAIDRLERGQDVPVVAGHLHKAEISGSGPGLEYEPQRVEHHPLYLDRPLARTPSVGHLQRIVARDVPVSGE